MTTITTDTTFDIPTDYATLQAAIDDLQANPGVTITLNIESAHQPTTGIFVKNGQFNAFRITSTDAEVTLGSGFTGIFIDGLNAHAPTLATVINMNHLGTYAVHIEANSHFYMEDNCGFKNSGGYGIYCNSSRVRCAFPVLTGCANRTVWATRNANVSLAEGDLGGQTAGDYGIYVSRGSMVDITNAHVNNMNVTDSAIIALRSRIAFIEGQCNDSGGIGITSSQCSQIGAQDTEVKNAADTAVFAQSASMIDFTNGDSRYAGIHGIHAISASQIAADGAYTPNAGQNASSGNGNSVRAEKGSTIDANGAELRYSNSNDEAYVTKGGIIVANGAIMTHGSPHVSDTNVSGFNKIDGNKGIIWG